MQTNPNQTILATVLGVAVGIMLTLQISGWNESDEPASEMQSDSQTAPQAVKQIKDRSSNPLSRLEDHRIRRNETRIQSLEHHVNDLSTLLATDEVSEAARDVEEQASELNEMSPEEAKARDLEWWENVKTAFHQEPTDEIWSAETSGQFSSDISELSRDKNFSLIHSECRTTQCEVIVEWPSFGEASVGFSDLLHHEYQANCARYTLLPEPAAGENDQPYEMTMIFDCSELRDQA